MATFIAPFGVGDVVKFVKQYECGIGSEGAIYSKEKIGVHHIIYSVSLDGINDYKYSTNRMAWIPHEAFELVRKADAKSIRELLKARRHY